MSIEQIKELLNEIAPEDKPEYRWIDCSEATGYGDDKQYERIITAIKQNLELQQEKKVLEDAKEQLQKENMELLMNVETLVKQKEDTKQEFLIFMSELCNYLSKFKNIDFPIRIGDYKFEVLGKDLLVYNYDPVKKAEPIKIEIELVENSTDELCPICNNELGKYPAISRTDNKTKICSNCGTIEALAIWKESLKNE